MSVAHTAEQQLPEPSLSHQLLDMFVGEWQATGQSWGEGQRQGDPNASAVAWTSTESYEWLPGRFFLLHRWDAMVGERVFRGTEILGHDNGLGGYFSRCFDDAGSHPEYGAYVDENIWTFTGRWTRAKVTFTEAGNRMRCYWEWRNEHDWLPLHDRVATRVR
jgi:hypothetical protein